MRRGTGDRGVDGGAHAGRDRRAHPQVRALRRGVRRHQRRGRLSGGGDRAAVDDARRHHAAAVGPQRQALVAAGACRGRGAGHRHALPAPPEIPLPEASGVFVTVKTHGELRGCLGTLDARPVTWPTKWCGARPMRRAAIRGSTPVAPAELPHLARRSVRARSARIDRSAAARTRSWSAGTGWSSNRAAGAACCCRRSRPSGAGTAEQFLRQTCVKAGLAPDAWQHGARGLPLHRGRLRRRLIAMPRLGAHLSIAGGLPRAVDRAVASRCEALQIFTKSAGQWRARVLPPDEIAQFRARVERDRHPAGRRAQQLSDQPGGGRPRAARAVAGRARRGARSRGSARPARSGDASRVVHLGHRA